MICQRHNEILDLEAELLDIACYDVAIEPTLQPLAGEQLNRGANTAPDACLDVHCRGFWERQQADVFDIWVCQPNADSYKELSPKQIYELHEDEKRQKYGSRIIEVENGTFAPLVLTPQQEVCLMQECQRYHSRLAELIPSISRMDQNEGVLRHPADCSSLFVGNKVTEKKYKCTGECTEEGACWTNMIIS